MAIKAVLFDIDGTLVDSNDYHVEAWRAAFESIGLRFGREEIHNHIGKGSDMFIPSLMPDGSAAERERVRKVHGDLFKGTFMRQVRPFPHARDLLLQVHDTGQKVVLASSASQDELDHYVDLLDVRVLLAATTSAADVKHTKPAPDIFLAALNKVAPIAAGEAIVVGDTPYDIQAASASAIAAIGVRSGKFSDEVLERAGAIALYDDVAALLAGYETSPLVQ